MSKDDITDDRLELAPESAPPASEKKGLWKKLQRGLLMTHTELIDRMGAALEGRAVLDDETLEYLEESLIAADLGVETALELVEKLKQRAQPADIQDPARLRAILAEEISAMLDDAPRPPELGPGPTVTLMVGVNGVGKTTTIAKLTRWLKDRGQTVLLAAGDTFRAAAIEQIALWAERLAVDVVRQKPGGDPAAVVYDAIQAARARKADHVIVDTAGRLHTKDHLMAELSKIGRVIEREAAGWNRRALLVLDATTGQNALIQAKEFARTAAVDGVVLTKLDGTAKGGMAVAVARELGLPVLYLGVGESPEDLVEFEPKEFAAALFA
ncbi:MAG: signal recognition particle-docking protein FtsY [bacterium]|nr:signal recognition particle-docking protein FtsY [bacterium]